MMSGISLMMTVINQRIAATDESVEVPKIGKLLLGNKAVPEHVEDKLPQYNPWKLLASKIDWICFTFLLVFVIISTIAMLLVIMG